MTTLAAKKRRERTNTNRKIASQTFLSPGGVYMPPYGKTAIYISGHGPAGTAPQAPSVSGYNPSTPGTIASYNPPSPGNIASYNPPTPGNISGYNPIVPGNPNYFPPNPGNTNSPTGYEHTYTSVTGLGAYTSYNTQPSNVPIPAPYTSFTTNFGGDVNETTYVAVNYELVPGWTNPSTPGNISGYNGSGGNAIYNPTIPGTANYNPPVSGNAIYNSPIPGNANYNNYVAGVAGQPFAALGVTFPGGDVGQPAPTVGRTMVFVSYTATGVPLSVPPGSAVVIEEI